jgi:surface antigen
MALGYNVRTPSRAMAVCALSGCVALTGCAADGSMSNKDLARGLFGCALGVGIAVLAHARNDALAACAGGAVVVMAIGQLLDKHEREQLRDASLRAAETGQVVKWGGTSDESTPTTSEPPAASPAAPAAHHPRKGHHVQPPPHVDTASNTPQNATPAAPRVVAAGWVVPVRTYVRNGQTCTDLEQHATKGDKSATGNVTACRTASGWVLPNAA